MIEKQSIFPRGNVGSNSFESCTINGERLFVYCSLGKVAVHDNSYNLLQILLNSTEYVHAVSMNSFTGDVSNSKYVRFHSIGCRLYWIYNLYIQVSKRGRCKMDFDKTNTIQALD